jgi:hypothetical protein
MIHWQEGYAHRGIKNEETFKKEWIGIGINPRTKACIVLATRCSMVLVLSIN